MSQRKTRQKRKKYRHNYRVTITFRNKHWFTKQQIGLNIGIALTELLHYNRSSMQQVCGCGDVRWWWFLVVCLFFFFCDKINHALFICMCVKLNRDKISNPFSTQNLRVHFPLLAAWPNKQKIFGVDSLRSPLTFALVDGVQFSVFVLCRK